MSGTGTRAALGVHENWGRCGGLEYGGRSGAGGRGPGADGAVVRRSQDVGDFDVRVGDVYDIISLFTLNLKGTTNDGHPSPAGAHSHSPLEPEFPNTNSHSPHRS